MDHCLTHFPTFGTKGVFVALNTIEWFFENHYFLPS